MINLQAKQNGFRFEHLIEQVSPTKKNVIIFSVTYLKGAQRKGVLVSIRPSEIEQGEGYTTESTLYNDANIFVWAKELARKNDKEVARVAEALDSSVPSIIAAYLKSPQEGKDALQWAITQAVR